MASSVRALLQSCNQLTNLAYYCGGENILFAHMVQHCGASASQLLPSSVPTPRPRPYMRIVSDSLNDWTETFCDIRVIDIWMDDRNCHIQHSQTTKRRNDYYLNNPAKNQLTSHY